MSEQKIMISEAAKLVDVESHVLRYWEEELHIPVSRTEMGHRYYTKENLQLFCCIKKLKDEGVTIKELKLLVPDLLAVQKKNGQAPMQKSHEEEAKTSPLPTSPKTKPCEAPSAEVVSDLPLQQVRELIGTVLTDVVTSNNEVLKKEISRTVSSEVLREMQVLMREKERHDEEHFRKLDLLIRQQQALRKEASAAGTATGKIRRIFT